MAPPWVASGAAFFVTICAADRANAALTRPEIARALLDAGANYHPRRWWCRIWLVMPDHVHGVVHVPPEKKLATAIGDWKRFTGRTCSVKWQANFFDHRIRAHESLDDKMAYIRTNPVRAGLVEDGADWPWVWMPSDDAARPV